MKKLIAFVMAIAMVTVLAACGGGNTATEPVAPEANVPVSALEILENVWGNYADDEKFPIMGGNVESGIMDAPGNYDMAYAENLTFNLLVPADQVANVTEAASMIHMMNANTFTCGVLRLAEGTDAAAFAGAMEQAVQTNQWMCGFPETLVISVIGGEYVLVAFGLNDAMTPFQTHLATAYPAAQTLYNEAIG